jgi:hypothetical protein
MFGMRQPLNNNIATRIPERILRGESMRYSHLSTTMAIILTLSVLLATCQSTANNDTEVISTLDFRFNELIIPSAHRNLDDAYILAREWNSDAILIDVGVSFPPDELSGFVRYTFLSKNNSKEFVIISYKDGNANLSISNVSLSYSSFREIELDRWLIDSTEAFEVAQLHGGQEHMLNTSGNIDIKLSLEVSIDNILVWTIGYRSLDGKGTMYIGVDATTGEFIWKVAP